MKKNNLLLIGSFPPPYHGSSIYLEQLHNLLLKNDDFEVLRINCSDNKKKLGDLGGWSYRNIFNALRALLKLIIYLTSKKIDIVYVPIAQNKSGFFRDGLAILFSKIFGKKVIIHLNGSYFREFYDSCDFIAKKFIDLVMKSADGAIVLAKNLKKIFDKWFSEERIFVLPNFVDNLEIIDYPKDNSKIIILYLSNLIKSKGLFDLIEACEAISKSNSNLKLLIIGKSANDPFANMTEDEILNFINEKVQNNNFIEFLGPIYEIQQKNNYISMSDIFALPSWYPVEGQPVSIIEAMSFGKPIISTKNCGAIEETVIDGYNGILVEKRNIEQLVNALLKLIENEELRKNMGKNSRLLYLEKYTPEAHYKLFKEILTKIRETSS